MTHESIAKRISKIAIVGVLAFLTAGAIATAVEYEASEGRVGKSHVVKVTDANRPRVNSTMLSKVAVAAPTVRHINMEMTKALHRTADPSEQRKIVVQAKDRQVTAIHRAGLTVSQYENTLIAAAHNPDLLAKLQKYMSTEETT